MYKGETITLKAIRETSCHQKILSNKLEGNFPIQICLTELGFYLPMLQHGFPQLILLHGLNQFQAVIQ